MSKVLQERGSGNLPSSTEANPRDHVKSISSAVKTDTIPIRRIGPSQYAVSGPQNNKMFFEPRQATIPFPSRLYDDYRDEEEGSYGLKDLDSYSIGTTLLDDALPTKEKDPRSFTLPCIINNLCFNKALADLGASASVMPFSTYIKLGLGELAPTKLVVELADRKLRKNQVDDLEPTNVEGEVIDKPMMDIVKTRSDDEIVEGLDEYPSYCDFNRKIHIDCAYNLQFSCMIDIAVVENMDAYHDDGMGDINVRRPFCRKACVKARRFDGMITIYKGNDSVSAQDELKGILHPYQKLKGFYKEVLNLGSEYVKNEKVEEWITHGH
ncbi:UBN2 domain-containing protein, partial [Tanacetum coccineum]